MNTVRKPSLREAWKALPEHVTGEIIAGTLHAAPRSGSRHARAGTRLAASLDPEFGSGGPGAWVILAEPELHLGEHILVPDLAGWRRERLPEVPEGAIVVVPDFVCEILSPATARRDRAVKLPLYASLGVAHAWLVDPTAKTVEVFRLSGAHWVLVAVHGDPDPMRAEPFDAVEIPLARLFEW
jgi:Uma2 family endonuclease